MDKSTRLRRGRATRSPLPPAGPSRAVLPFVAQMMNWLIKARTKIERTEKEYYATSQNDE